MSTADDTAQYRAGLQNMTRDELMDEATGKAVLAAAVLTQIGQLTAATAALPATEEPEENAYRAGVVDTLKKLGDTIAAHLRG